MEAHARVRAMATPRPQQKTPQMKRTITYNRDDPDHQVIDPRWLMKVLLLVILAAFVCAYLAMCALFSLGSWQLVLHPTRVANQGTGLATENVRFGPDGGGRPQLAGEFFPADAGAPSRAYSTVLYLRTGDGQLNGADAPLLTMLHGLGLNVLAFDYRGFGQSAQRPHPAEKTMVADAESAWNYLTGLRGIPQDHILIYGAGTGGSLAIHLAQRHAGAAALVLRNATAHVLGTVQREPRSRFFPVRLLFHERFPLTGLSQLAMPKLLLDVGPNDVGPENRARRMAYAAAANPKMTVEMPGEDPAKETEALRRFLDERTRVMPPPLLPPQLPTAK